MTTPRYRSPGRQFTDEERQRGHRSHSLDVGPHRRWIRRTVSRLRNDGPLGDDLADAPGHVVIRAAAAAAFDQVIRLAALEVVATEFRESFGGRRRLAVLREVQSAFRGDAESGTTERVDKLCNRLFNLEDP